MRLALLSLVLMLPSAILAADRSAPIDGERATIRGTYEEIDVREKQTTPPVHVGHVALRQTDGTFVYLGQPWGSASIRSASERKDLGGQLCTAIGVFHSTCPIGADDRAAHIVGPCLLPVESVSK